MPTFGQPCIITMNMSERFITLQVFSVVVKEQRKNGKDSQTRRISTVNYYPALWWQDVSDITL